MRALTAVALAASLVGCDRAPEQPALPPPTPNETAAQPPPEPEPAAAPLAIPAAYQGRWGASPERCAIEGDEMRLAVSPDALRFYESEGKVAAVRSIAPRTIEVDASFTGEGESWQETRILTVSADGQTLSVKARGTKADRIRCS